MNDDQKIIDEQFKKLPPNLQQAIEAVPWKSQVNEIALLHKLSLEQALSVERETMFIIYGFENPDDYVKNLETEVPLDEDTATAIADGVDNRIFKEIANKAALLNGPDESKEDATKRLKDRMGTDVEKPTSLEMIHENLPMVEPGETVHDVPHVEEKPTLVPEIPKPEPAPEVKTETKTEVEVKPNPVTPTVKPQIGDESKAKPQVPTYTSSYNSGKDPYREPLE